MQTTVKDKTGHKKKRRGKRYPLSKPFQFTCSSYAAKVLKGFIVDMSYSSGLGVSGIGVCVHEGLQEGQEIEIKSRHRSQHPQKATVRWVDPLDDSTYRAGLMFAE